jgi:hypothetical protein
MGWERKEGLSRARLTPYLSANIDTASSCTTRKREGVRLWLCTYRQREQLGKEEGGVEWGVCVCV